MATERARRALAALLVAAALAAASAAPARALQFDPARMIGIDEIHPGMKGVARTVFQGTRIEEFDVLVLSVMRHTSSDGDLVLVQLLGDRLAHTGVAAGMSGSPVYFGGRLAGAIALGWSFSKDAVAGVTPIEQMIRCTEVSPRAAQGEMDPEPLGPGERMAPLPLLLASSGGSALLPALADSLLPAGAPRFAASGARGTEAPAEPPGDLVPGAAVGISLVRGDMDLSAVGTVTWRDGDEVLCFGHPLMGLGSVSMPLTTAYVHTILSSELSSMKLASTGPAVGALVQDRAYAVRGRMGAKADEIPVTLAVADEDGRVHTFRYRVLRHPALTPALAAIALGDGIGTALGGMPRAALPYTAAVYYPGGKLEWQDQPASGPGGGGPVMDLARDVALRVNLLVGNSWSRVPVDSVRLSARVLPGSHGATVEAAWLAQGRVRAGGRVGVAVRVRPELGEARVETLSLDLPAHMPPGRYRVVVGDVDSRLEAERVRAPGVYRFTSLEQALDALRARGTHAALYAAVYSDDVGASARGRELPALPGGALAILDEGRQAGSVQWVKARRWAEAQRALPETLNGSAELNFNLESEAP